MNDKVPQAYPEKTNLTLIKKEDAEKMHAKLITLAKPATKEGIVLPTQAES
jgi:hypothetical protein